MRILYVDIRKLDGFPAAKFDILKPRWLPTSIVQHLNNCRSGRDVADPRKTAQIGVPKHRAKAVDRSTLDRA